MTSGGLCARQTFVYISMTLLALTLVVIGALALRGVVLGIVIVLGAMLFVPAIMAQFHVVRLADKVLWSNGRYCTRCGYVLPKASGQLVCPECGACSTDRRRLSVWTSTWPVMARIARLGGAAPMEFQRAARHLQHTPRRRVLTRSLRVLFIVSASIQIIALLVTSRGAFRGLPILGALMPTIALVLLPATLMSAMYLLVDYRLRRGVRDQMI